MDCIIYGVGRKVLDMTERLSLSFHFPQWLSSKESACQCRRHRRCGFDPWVRKILWRRTWQPTPVFCPGGSVDRQAWRAMVCGVAVKRLSMLACRDFTHIGSWSVWGSLISLTMSLRLIRVAVCVWRSCFLRLHDIPLRGTAHCICSYLDGRLDFPTSGLLWIVLLCTRLCKHRLRPGFQFFWVYSQKWSCRNTW